ncbi:MAG: F-type H+-transporting ATPase subunit gamma [bacterium P3]|nr:MAG: F-type H+-transporting ATPase subunit gamma [bacterium P3]KWW40391.1 MAG: F-type H+-transporting ATPase subunit gamma [bacterium F083]
MANLKEVRTRIASVSSTQQITSAMKMVSAAKFRRAQNSIIGMRPYATQLADIIASMDVGDSLQTPYHERRRVSRILLVAVTSNKGLCGAFNANVIRQAEARLQYYRDSFPAATTRMVAIGKRGADYFAKQKGLVCENRSDLLDATTFDAVASLADSIMQQYRDKEYDLVEVIYNQFKNSLTQILSTEQFLPVAVDSPRDRSGHAVAEDYIYEPGKEAILREMVPLSLRSQFYRIMLDSLAAEHGARMTAMQKATDNATELLKELKLSYNKARQTSITNEIIEIVSGSEALKR